MVERKYLAHFLDAAFDTTYSKTNYVRLGVDLEEFTEELQPDVQTTKNILGETSVKVAGYEPQSNIDKFYYDYNEALSEKIADIANSRATGDACKSSMVDVLLKPDPDDITKTTVVWAYREDIVVIPTSMGGDTTGIQIPFEVRKTGNRIKGTFNLTTKTFTPENATLV